MVTQGRKVGRMAGRMAGRKDARKRGGMMKEERKKGW